MIFAEEIKSDLAVSVKTHPYFVTFLKHIFEEYFLCIIL